MELMPSFYKSIENQCIWIIVSLFIKLCGFGIVGPSLLIPEHHHSGKKPLPINSHPITFCLAPDIHSPTFMF